MENQDPHDKWIDFLKWLATGYVKLAAGILLVAFGSMATFGCCYAGFFGAILGLSAIPQNHPTFPAFSTKPAPYQPAPRP